MQFTTLIPAYKSKYLVELLISLRNQTVKPTKIIFSDDSADQAFQTALTTEPLRSAVSDLNIEVIRGPRNGGYNNFRHLLARYDDEGPRATDLFHLLLDDDILYPTFYERHREAHLTGVVPCVVSRRWTANESGQPIRDDLPVPPAISQHGQRTLAIEPDVLFAHTVGASANWLGEFSNTTFRRSMARPLCDTTMAGISFAGLEDLGGFLKAGLDSPIGFINDHLGFFRLSAEQNSANPMGRPLKLAFLAYIALAIAARKLGKITVAQSNAAVARTCLFVRSHYSQQSDMHDICAVMPGLVEGVAGSEREFLSLWQVYSRHPGSHTTSVAEHRLGIPEISVLIPVYNGAVYLSKTLDALLAQSFQNFEVLCIDDGSKDTSLDLLQTYADRDQRVKITKTPANMGCVPKVLNFALPQVRGRYLAYASQDDLFSSDWLQKMHDRAVETGADAVIPDLSFFYESEPERCTSLIGLRGDRDAELTGREAVQYSLDWTIPCNALWRADLIQRLRYADFAYNADEYSGRVFFLHCNKVVFSEGTFLYRQDNAGAITKTTTYRGFDAAYTHFKLYLWLRDNQFPAEVYASEALRAMRAFERMQAWLKQADPGLSDHDRNEAIRLSARCEAVMRAHGFFDIFAAKESTP